MNGTTNTTNTVGHGTGVMGKIKNALDPNVNTSGGTTTGTGVPHQHHTGRDAALTAGGVGILQHERNEHPGAGHMGTGTTTGATGTTGHHHHVGRDAALAGAGVGALEHHRNHRNAEVANTGTGAGYGNTTGGGFGNSAGGGYGNSATGTGAGLAGAGAGTGVGAGTGTANVNPSNSHAGATHFKGKLQEGLGNLTGNPNMQAKGIANQEQANAERYQTGQISEAQRLEGQAQARRGNAVTSGAHPSHGAAGL
ncbi:hypothetical protein CALVIDRAFT_560121 [Calocera viscosa TUFC12733]|uniref:CsbD-like domain-containing protein n=1 Tax=Calocera viscosa (strain TUFC12733) TaxID=1330018 RepID=A0A167RDI4_CALVF|nr:hypothetical protein CALVIDRAFT_560121 [Calocera viscosa TUFC12733]